MFIENKLIINNLKLYKTIYKKLSDFLKNNKFFTSNKNI